MLFLSSEVGVLKNILRTLFAFLCKIIYPLISNVWDLFVYLSKAEIFNSSGDGIVSNMYTRVGLLLGLIMLFRIVFSLIQMFINPDSFLDREKGIGAIIKKMLVVILLLAFTPTIFEKAFDVQKVLIEDNVVGRIVLGTNQNLDNFGTVFSANLFSTFYVLNPVNTTKAKEKCDMFDLTTAQLRDYNRLDLIDTCITSTFEHSYDFDGLAASVGETEADVELYAIDFDTNGLFAVLVGGFVLWIIVMYCIYLGARVVLLAFLQVIAPVAIISYLSPQKNNGLFKWGQICLSTFIDVFIRTAMIYFISLIIYLLYEGNGEGIDLIQQSTGATGTMLVLVEIAIILGLLIIAKKVPDLLGEIFPSLGGKGKLGLGISWKKLTESMVGGSLVNLLGKAGTVGVAGAAVGSAVGFLGRSGTGKVGGLLSGIGRGFVAGSSKGGVFKSLGNAFQRQAAANKSYAEWRAAGGTSSLSRLGAAVNQKLGLPTAHQRTQEELDEMKRGNEITKTRATSARSAYSAFDAASSTGKDAKRTANTHDAIGAGGNDYITKSGLVSKLAAAGININNMDTFASILERAKATKEREATNVANIDSKLIDITSKKTALRDEWKTTSDRSRKVEIQSELRDLDNQATYLTAERDAAIKKSEIINIGEVEKILGEARMNQFLSGEVSDGKAKNEYEVAMSTVSTVISTLRNTGNGANDEDANILEQYVSAVKDIYENGYSGAVTVNGKTYDSAYKLYDDMATYAQEVANKNDDKVRGVDEEMRRIQNTDEYISDKADNDHSGAKR